MSADILGERIWSEIDLDNVIYNYNLISDWVNNKELMPVIKGNAYGHGAIQVAKALIKAGAKRFAVATPYEALQLRKAGISLPVLILGAVPPEVVSELVDEDISLCLPNMDIVKSYKGAMCGGKRLKIHIKVDTGMTRLGLDTNDAVNNVLKIASDPSFEIEGIFTHFAAADDSKNNQFTRTQFEIFQDIIKQLVEKEINIPFIHCANSEGILHHAFSYVHFNLVRSGIALFGYGSKPEGKCHVRPVMSLRAQIVQLRWIESGKSVGYSRTWTAKRKTLVAVVSAGYADGIRRNGSGKITMLVQGKKALQIGLICMDMCMLDVTDIRNVKIGDTVTILGEDGSCSINADELAIACGTISYEIICTVGERVPRYYISSGHVVSQHVFDH